MTTGNTTHGASRKRAELHKFYFVRPRVNANADKLAERLISLKQVEEVFLTDGDYGFVVKARFYNDREPHDVARYISRNVGTEFGKVVSYCQYSK